VAHSQLHSQLHKQLLPVHALIADEVFAHRKAARNGKRPKKPRAAAGQPQEGYASLLNPPTPPEVYMAEVCSCAATAGDLNFTDIGGGTWKMAHLLAICAA